MALRYGLQAYYKFDENSGSSVGDSSGNSNTGTWNGTLGSQWITGRINSAGNFDGSTNNVSVADSTSLDPTTNAMTISAWCYPTAASYTFGTIVKKLNQYILRIEGTTFRFYTTTGAQVQVASSGSFTQNSWNHVVGVYDASKNPSLVIYINGVSSATGNNQSGNLVTSTNVLTMGAASGGITENFTGRIDEVAIWNRGLSAVEVAQLYGPAGAGFQYPFNEVFPNFYVAPTLDFISINLKGQISSGSTLIALATIANLQAPGYVVIDRTNTATPPSSTPTIREVVSFNSISSINLVSLTRAADGGNPQAHNDGALVETIWTIGMWNSLSTILQISFDSQGLLRATTSPMSIQGMQSNTIYTSVASIAIANIITKLDVSAASVTGLGFMPIFTGSGAYSGPTVAIGGLYIAPRAGTLKWVSAITRYVASGTSVGFDFQIRGASVFANATTRPAIAAGGTFVSTASIATLNINPGDILQANVDSMGSGLGLIQEVTVSGGTL